MKSTVFFICKYNASSKYEVVEIEVDFEYREEVYNKGYLSLMYTYEEIKGMFGRKEYAQDALVYYNK